MSRSASPATLRAPSLADIVWPSRPGAGFAALRAAILVIAGTALLAISAKVQVPLPFVPMTMQTLVVLLIGAAYGWRLGTVTVLAYLAEGAMGLPVFAGPTAGIGYMAGPTAGYLAGFVGAAFVTGWLAERGWDRSVPRIFVAMGIGHVLILVLGFAWLAFGLRLGVEKAWLVGIVPFIAASVLKNALGAAIMPLVMQAADRKRD